MKLLANSLIPLLLSLLIALAGCDGKIRSAMASGQAKAEDGFYLVKRKGNRNTEILPLAEGETVIAFNPEFYEKTDQDQRYIVVDSREFVPMKLKQKPQTEVAPADQEDSGFRRNRLLLTLTDDAREQLTAFTTQHLNQLTTIVVGGEALTIHKIRTVIDSGLMQITRCTDNACELLLVELQDNVAEE